MHAAGLIVHRHLIVRRVVGPLVLQGEVRVHHEALVEAAGVEDVHGPEIDSFDELQRPRGHVEVKEERVVRVAADLLGHDHQVPLVEKELVDTSG